MRLPLIAVVGLLAITLAPVANADVRPAKKVCDKDDYACMQVSTR